MENYQQNISAKTRLLNIFRSPFVFSPMDALLLNLRKVLPYALYHKLIPPEYLYSPGRAREVVRRGLRLRLDPSHVVDHFLYWDLKEKSIEQAVAEARMAHVILDVGANIGAVSLQFAKANPSARILSFEPHPLTFKRAQYNIGLNKVENIELLPFGLGEKKDTVRLYEVNSNNPGMNRIIPGDQSAPFQEIQIEELDALLEARGINSVDFIKLDVEGYEHSVLKGGKGLLQRCHPVLFIELDDTNLRTHQSSARMLMDFLQACGYKQFLRADTLSVLRPDEDHSGCHFDILVKP